MNKQLPLRTLAIWFCSLLGAALVLCCSPAMGNKDARRVCALIDLSNHPAAGALEAKLFGEFSDVDWVERAQIDKVFKEQDLAAAFGANAGPQRAAFGNLIKADVLILIRERAARGEQPATLECSVCETSRGLRLATTVLPADAKDATETLFVAIEQGLKKQQEKITHIAAVPPFLSEDLGYEHNHLQSAFARVVEQQLLRQPGILVVELEEAQAVAKEFALTAAASETAARQLPLYVLGRYRHDGKQGEESLGINLRLVRGDKQLNLKNARDLVPKRASEWLAEQTASLWDVEHTFTAEPLSAAIEARQLYLRAALFQRIGAWDEAIALLEASLLVQPDQDEAHRQAVIVCGHLARKYFNYNPGSVDEAAAAYNHYERGLYHLEAFLATAGELSKYKQAGQTDFITQFDHSLNGFAVHPKVPQEVANHIEQVVRRRSATYLRIARLRHERGFQSLTDQYFAIRALSKLPDSALTPALRALAKDFEGLPDEGQRLEAIVLRGYTSPPDSPATEQFIDDLRQMKSATARSAGESLKQKLLAARARPKEVIAKPEPVASDLKLEPVTLHVAGGSLAKVEIERGAKAGAGVDFFVAYKKLFVMRKPGELRLVAEFPANTWVTSLVYDGRYMWLAATRHLQAPLVLVIDPISEKKWQFTSEDGLPILPEGKVDQKRTDSIRLAPVKPGQVCAAGRTGPSWLALLNFDGKKSAKLFHEARETPNPESKEQGMIAGVMFSPGFMLSMFSSDEYASDCRILLGRSTGNLHATARPLIIDPQRETVEVAPYEISGNLALETLTSHRGSIYLQQYADKKLPIVKISPSHAKPERVFEDAPEVWLVPAGEQLHLIGRQWLMADPQKGTLTTTAKQTPWYFPTSYGISPSQRRVHEDDVRLISVMPSHHYGTLIVTRQRTSGVHLYRLVP
ncbi:MAG TPA: hypothetical protein VL096_18910 [Pirellulaceae bacterium]|nr:hypothetical protein [Pirellulaceae bacterium]